MTVPSCFAGSYVYYDPEYDNLGRMTRSYTYETNGTTSPITDFDYDYVNNENNIWKKQFDHRDSDPYNEYEYDDLDRLTVAIYIDDANEVFTMDDLGNRSNVNLRSGSNQVYDVNDLTNRYNDIDSNDCTYDAAGNMTVDPNGYQYSYDYENRIIEIEDSGDTTVAEYAYDALGRRIKTVSYDSAGSAATYFYYNDQWQVLAEYDGTSFGNSFVYGNYIDEVLVMNDGTNDYYYAHDHLYSPVALMETDGDVVERYEYDAYGKVHVLDTDFSDDADGLSDVGNPYLFTGRRLDVLDSGNLKIMYYRNRYYHPEIGRFMTHDPLGINPDKAKFFIAMDYRFNELIVKAFINHDPEKDILYYWPNFQYFNGHNLFGYILNNPTNRIDPFGKLFRHKKKGEEEPRDSRLGMCGAYIDVITHDGRFADESGNFKHCYLSCMIAKDPLNPGGGSAAMACGLVFECFAGDFSIGDLVADSIGSALGKIPFVNCAKACDKFAPPDDWWDNPPNIPFW
ncbi:RHS repeat protein [bacterium]|nr:RHS repeat protein [bacterium]